MNTKLDWCKSKENLSLCSPKLEQDNEKRPSTPEREEKINRAMGYLLLHTVLYYKTAAFWYNFNLTSIQNAMQSY